MSATGGRSQPDGGSDLQPDAPAERRFGPFLLTTLLMTGAYFLAARYGLALLVKPNGVAVFWPASGLAVGAVLVLGRTAIWPIAIGVGLATIGANLTGGRPTVLAFPFAAANVVEFLTVAWLTERRLGEHVKFDTLRRVFGLFLAATVGTLIGGAIGGFAIGTLGNAEGMILTHWQAWFRSDLIGIVAITPLAVGLKSLSMSQDSGRDHVEGLLLLIILSASAMIIYPGTLTPDGHWLHPPEALLFPLLLLLAIRQPITYAPIGAAVVALSIVASIVSEGVATSDTEVFRAQIAILSMAACSLSLAALIAERRFGETRQRLLIAELDHRVKNGLALVQAIVERSRESTSSIDDFYIALGGRIRSMARTHTMLSREKWHGLPLSDLIANELAPYQTSKSGSIRGPKVMLGPTLAQSLSLVLHELSANAAKYGALSHWHGKVHVSWHVEQTADGDMDLVISWEENSSQPVGRAGPPGFGTTTIRDLLRYEAKAIILLAFPPEGARCTIRLPKSTADFTVV